MSIPFVAAITAMVMLFCCAPALAEPLTVKTDLPATHAAYLDGEPLAFTTQADGTVTVDVAVTGPAILTLHTYFTPADEMSGPYPTAMRVWMLDNAPGEITAQPLPLLDDALRYCGTSIRVSGKRGIRVITGIPQTTRAALLGGNLYAAGTSWHLAEYGTVAAFADTLSGGTVLTTNTTMQNHAYRAGVADPIFAVGGGLVQYTNVLVGFATDQCPRDLQLRPYLILESAEGARLTVYGGTVERSIGNIAYQNRGAFRRGTGAYAYIWNIIRAVYGNRFDTANNYAPILSDLPYVNVPDPFDAFIGEDCGLGPGTTVLCIGDSFLEGYTPEQQQISWGEQIALMTGANVIRYAEGGAGFYCAGSRRHNFAALAELAWRDGVQPDVIIIGGGINDSTQNIYIANMQLGANQLVKVLRAHWPNTPVFVFVNLWGNGQSFQLDSHYTARNQLRADVVRSAFGSTATVFTDCWDWIYITDDYSLMSYDGIHPTSTGHALLAQKILARIAWFRQQSDAAAALEESADETPEAEESESEGAEPELEATPEPEVALELEATPESEVAPDSEPEPESEPAEGEPATDPETASDPAPLADQSYLDMIAE